MPELSKPIIAVIGVLVSIAILFIAVLGILPFLQGTIGGVSEQVQFSAVASAAASKSGGTINKIVFTVTVQRLAETGTFRLLNPDSVQIFEPDGTPFESNEGNVSLSFNNNLDFTTSTTFTVQVSPESNKLLDPGTWVLVITIYDLNNNTVQSLSISVPVS